MLTVAIISSIFMTHVSSQGCPLTPRNDRSPNSPPTANCDIGFWTELTPEFDCLCCNFDFTPGDDAFPNECRFATPPTLDKVASGTLTCNTNWDCCSCDKLICNNCGTIECIGDKSCFGVDEIFAFGGCEGQGVDVVCGGDISCFRSGIIGDCVKSLRCNGDRSCAESIFTFNMGQIVPNRINALDFPFNGDLSAPGTTITANNVGGVSCGGDNSCAGSTFTMNCVSNGCTVNVGGDEAAVGATWDITNVRSFTCEGPSACILATITLTCLDNGPGCLIKCGASCSDATFQVTNSFGISCSGVAGCRDGLFTLIDNTGGFISCATTESCLGADFIATAGGNIENIDSVLCSGIDACRGALVNVKARNAAFLVSCGSSGACFGSTFNIETRFNVISSFKCSGMNSCEDATININRVFNSNNRPLTRIQTIEFGAANAGLGATFNIRSEGNIRLDSVLCNNERSCQSITINIDLLSTNNNVDITLQCGGQFSCIGALINIERIGIPVSVAEINSFDINIACNVGNACIGAQVNGIPFTAF